MMPAARSADQRFWLVCLAAGIAVLAGCALPTIEVGQGAFVGAGDSQRSFDYDRTIHFATYVRPGSLLFVVGGVALVLVSAVALLRGSNAALVLVAAAVSLAFVVESIRIGDELRWEGSGVYSCGSETLERCVPFIAPAVRDLQADIRGSRAAREPGFELLEREGYRARGKLGWWIIVWTSIVLAAVTAFRAFMLFFRPLWAGIAVVLCAFAILVYLLLESLENLE